MFIRSSVSVLFVALLSSTASAQTLVEVEQNTLPLALSQAGGNRNLQTMGINETTEELVFMNYSTRQFISMPFDRNSTTAVTSDEQHLVGATAYNGFLYFVSFTGNTSGQDMHRMSAAGGASSNYGTDVGAYGGFPIDIRDGLLYRTDYSTQYNWASLDELWVSNVSSPNSFIRQVSVPSPNGIGDIAVDLDSNSLWVIEWLASAKIRRHDLTTGALIEEFQTVGNGREGGITYYDGLLYHYEWVIGASTLTVYETGLSNDPGCASGYDGYNLNGVDGDETCIHTTATVDETVQIDAGATVGPNAIIAPRVHLRGSADVGQDVVVGRNADIDGTLGTGTIVARDAFVGEGADIGASSFVGFDASIGSGATLGPSTIIGNRVSVGIGAAVGNDGGSGNVVVGRSTTIGDNGTTGSQTVIGPDVSIGQAQLGASLRIRKDATVSNQAEVGDSARIGRGASVGFDAEVAEGTHLAAGATVSDNACIATTNTRVPRNTTVTGGCN